MKKAIFLALLASLMVSTLGVGLMSASTVTAKETEDPTNLETKSVGFIAMSVSVGLACLGAGYALARTCTAAVGAVAEKPEIFSQTFIYVVFCEAIAIYGLAVAFIIAAML
ncbi:MAG: ATP synthase subunit C [Nitrososphaerota archaeon]|nr:ATP synthase subunit C [Candidatus Bathyarchaeota archaeon]MCX8162159.1 ATP synthase subunit C [Candidatus Bathyarchaeota archaeon]MDW8061564.1 ATP synthase subunit C [Nitrososphaerota archaeon]